MQRYRYLLALLSLGTMGLLLPLAGPHGLSVQTVPDATSPQLSSSDLERSKNPILGVLEHYDSGKKKGHGVRVVFYKESEQWKAFPMSFNNEKELSQVVRYFPQAVTWTICFDGRSLGSLASKTPQSYDRYADIGMQEITSKASVPTVGQPSALFSGWPGGRTYRPLILNSRPYCVDPSKWRPGQPQQRQISAIKDYLHKTFQVSASKLSKARIKVNKCYGSDLRQAKLISVDIAGIKLIPVDSEDDQNTAAWFYIKEGEIRYLGSNMLLVDIGDYDQNGAEEAMFKIQRYNNDGYTLYYDGFNKKVEFSWAYH